MSNETTAGRGAPSNRGGGEVTSSPFAYGASYDDVVTCERCPARTGPGSRRFCAHHRAQHATYLHHQIGNARAAFLAGLTPEQQHRWINPHPQASTEHGPCSAPASHPSSHTDHRMTPPHTTEDDNDERHGL